tara:strand:+ start:298 stop:852 length:555 start_codon:yes stop_codon:yes gene_type:complete
MLLQMFIEGLLTGVFALVLVLFVQIIINYIKESGESSWFGISILITMFLLFSSCSKEEVYEDVCGDCLVNFEVPFEKDENGYFIANLVYNSSGSARFNIDTYATITDAYTYSIFKGNINIDGYENTYVVQNSRLDHNDQGFTRRIVGPVLSKFKGDTLVVDVETYWEGNSAWEVSKNTLKFIIK